MWTETFDQAVGTRIRELRMARGLSQSDLASELSADGFQFRQQTVLKIEKGLRPLKLDEALAIAGVLGVQEGILWERDRPIATDSWVIAAIQRVVEEWEELTNSVDRLADAVGILQSRSEMAGSSLDSHTRGQAEMYLSLDQVKIVEAHLAARHHLQLAQNAEGDGAVVYPGPVGYSGAPESDDNERDGMRRATIEMIRNAPDDASADMMRQAAADQGIRITDGDLQSVRND